MALFKPDMRISKMIDITPEMLHSLGIRALLLDIDNTMTTHNNPVPADGVREWLEEMKSQGFMLMVVSNNNGERVRKFSQLLGLYFEGSAKKPLPVGFRRACTRLGIQPKEAAVIGDQIFTDIMGGNLLGACTIMTEVYEPEPMFFFKIKRACERFIMKFWKD
ncbi:MAG: YqeG family HAD IIIA-type phosphatase [Clostridia bacterium]|nr:YqeG family HAD IIIA-type phosphatase [Clostridia bacterium]